jgi:hypothetical protein
MLQGVIGGVDVFLNHELLARLPQRADTGTEEGLHSAREFVFMALFLSLAWFEWHGVLVLWIAALLLCEVVISSVDVVVEGNTRILPVPERVLHVFLFMNLGVVIVLVVWALLDWWELPTGVTRVDYGWGSWVLTAMAALALGWGVRDGLNVLQRSRGQVPQG